jgi:hypothetical protein
MATPIIWPGSSSFSPGDTPFGFYDNDPVFAADADKFADFAGRRLGHPITEVELQDKQFFTAFEEAVTVYGNEIYNFRIRDNYLSLEGSNTGSSLNNTVINPNLGGIIRIANNYGSEAGVGGFVQYHSGSIMLEANKQKYDLNAWASSSASLQPGDSIELKRVFYEGPPAMVRFFDPYAGTGTGFQSLMEAFGFGSFSPGINFMLMPIHFDLEKIQSIEFNDTVRKSAYSFEVVNNQLKIFPIPTRGDMVLFFEYIKRSERDSPVNPYYSGSNLVTNPSNVPYNNPVYRQINSVGRQWIYQYALAIAKETLGWVRGKYSTVPIPGSEVTLNGSELIGAAKEEKAALLEQLRAMLDDTSRHKQLERKQAENTAVNNTLAQIPLPFYIG